MSRINTNVQSLIAQRVLGQNNATLNQSLERLSTGIRINRGKDDPAGLIASENLRSEIKATNTAISNATRADQVLNIAEGGLQEVSSLLTELQGLLTATASAAGLSAEEKAANQVQIDSILQTIDRISDQTNFQGIKLLNGNFDYQTSAVSSNVADFKIFGAKFNSTSQPVNVNVTSSAQQGQLFLNFGASFGADGLNLNGNGANNSAFTIEITGSLGSRELSFASGTDATTIVSTINSFSDVTGITASASANGVALVTQGFGSNSFVSVNVVNGADVQGDGIIKFEDNDATTLSSASEDITAFSAAGNGVRDAGADLVANINGVAATSNGKTIRVNTDVLDVQITLTTEAAQQLQTVNAFQIAGGGADFQLAGNVDIAGKVSIGIASVASRKIGKTEDADNAGNFFFLSDLASGKALNVVGGDLTKAQQVIGEAINNVSSLRGQIGAFQTNTLQSTIRNLSVAVENTQAANSVIRDADFASETAALTRSQILQQASINSLSLANAQPQNALALLG